jgi:hypothetical protein
MHAENVEKLSISLPSELEPINCELDQGHNDDLERAYRDAVQEFDTAWEITAKDGLSNETW